MSQTQKYQVFIAVHKASPLDYQKYRHTAIYLRAVDESEAYYCHVRGHPTEFEFEKRVNYDPAMSATIAKMVTVGTTKVAATADAVTSVLQNTEVKNQDPEFNCQQWVDAALQRMYNAGWITEKEYSDGVDGMIDATREAADEPSP